MNKPTKIRAGHYTYKGVRIIKFTTKGFCAIAHTNTGWHYIGLSTLANATKKIDDYLAQGFEIYATELWTPQP